MTFYPVLFLYVHNINEVQFRDVVPSLAVVLVLALLVGLMFRIWLRDWHKASIALSLFIILFFSYGSLYHVLRVANLRGYILWGYQIGVNTYLLPLWTLVLLTAFYRIWRSQKAYQSTTKILNIIAVTLIVITGVQILASMVNNASEQTWQAPSDNRSDIVLNPPAECPDIYFIVLDGYVRSDILQRDYPRGNNDFIDSLQQKGFYVVSKSHSNYLRTHVSLTTTLNLEYLNDLGTPEDKKYTRSLYRKRYCDNLVFRTLKQLGYDIISFPTGYKFTDLQDASIDQYVGNRCYLSEFENELFNMTPMMAINMLEKVRYNKLRARVIFPLQHLATIPDYEHPIFVMAHVVCPHEPFVFGPQVEKENRLIRLRWDDWELLNPKGIELYKTLYVDQVAHLNQLLLKMVDQVLARPGKKPIIILQADHGDRYMLSSDQWPGSADPHDPFAIFNAIYFPDGDYTQLYDTLSPVNTFRILFNKYFGTDYALLPDQCFLDVYADMYDFSEITEFMQRHKPDDKKEIPAKPALRLNIPVPLYQNIIQMKDHWIKGNALFYLLLLALLRLTISFF